MKTVQSWGRDDLLPVGRCGGLTAVIGPDSGRKPAQQRQIGQNLDHIRRGASPPHPDRKALAGELVQRIEHTKGAVIVDTVMDDV